MKYVLSDKARIGDHIWYISDVSKFQKDYPNWHYEYDCDRIINEMVQCSINNKVLFEY